MSKGCFLVCEKILIIAIAIACSVQLGRKFLALKYTKNTKFLLKMCLFCSLKLNNLPEIVPNYV